MEDFKTNEKVSKTHEYFNISIDSFQMNNFL